MYSALPPVIEQPRKLFDMATHRNLTGCSKLVDISKSKLLALAQYIHYLS